MMFTHNLKMAWRNLGKFRTQSWLSIMGLAVGFAAFAFTMSWIRYEKTFDADVEGRERIYLLVQLNPENQIGDIRDSQMPLATYIRLHYPEVEAATCVQEQKQDVKLSDRDSLVNAQTLKVDSAFFDVFYPTLRKRRPAALPQNGFFLNERIAREKNVDLQQTDGRYLGMLPDPGRHTNLPFDALYMVDNLHDVSRQQEWCSWYGMTFVKMQPGADIDSLCAKINRLPRQYEYAQEPRVKAVPLNRVFTDLPTERNTIHHSHLRIFAIVSLLVTLSALFNFLMLFINRIKLRSRELVLCRANGAGDRQLVVYLLTEYFLIILISLFVGLVLMELLYPPFAHFSQITAERPFFLRMAIYYTGGLLLFSGLVGYLPVRRFMSRSIQSTLRPGTSAHSGSSFAMTSLWVQIATGILLIFCTVVLMMQVHWLNDNQVAGFDRTNVYCVRSYDGISTENSYKFTEYPIDELKAVPGVQEIIVFPTPFLPQNSWSTSTIENEVGGKKVTATYQCYSMGNAEDFARFFHTRILEGRNLHRGEKDVCLLNEAAVKQFGQKDPIGKKLGSWTVVGVIQHLHTGAPTEPMLPTIYTSWGESDTQGNAFAYRCHPQDAPGIEKAFAQIMNKYVVGAQNQFQFNSMEDEYAHYTRSERYLLRLLGVMTAVAILISIFGIYSMVTLHCNHRRKEIAIRKVSGAGIRDIIWLFFRQYARVVIPALVVALPLGYWVMHRWIQQYTRQVNISIWVFIGVTLLSVTVIYVSILSRVMKAAYSNPARVLKSE